MNISDKAEEAAAQALWDMHAVEGMLFRFEDASDEMRTAYRNYARAALEAVAQVDGRMSDRDDLALTIHAVHCLERVHNSGCTFWYDDHVSAEAVIAAGYSKQEAAA